MIAIARPQRQPSLSSLPSFHDAETDYASSTTTTSASDFDEEYGLLDFAKPPKPLPMRRSFRKLRSIHSRTGSSSTCRQPLKRTLSQKRKRQHVCFRDDNLTEIETIDRIPEGCKEDVWYTAKELSNLTTEELIQNWRVHILRGADYPLEEDNLTWRGLEEHIPAPDNNGDFEDGGKQRLDKISTHVQVVLAIASTNDGATSTIDEDIELAEHSWRLSKTDRDEAIEKAQKDAFEALREHGVEYGPTAPPSATAYQVANPSDDNLGVIKSLVTWFCL